MGNLRYKLAMIDRLFMAAVYTLNILSELGYCHVMMGPDYSVPQHPGFFWFYLLSSGAMVLLAGQLLWRGPRCDGKRSMWLLLWLTGLQFGAIAADIVYAVMHGELWMDGYVFLILELLFIAAYLRRYAMLRAARERGAEDGI